MTQNPFIFPERSMLNLLFGIVVPVSTLVGCIAAVAYYLIMGHTL
jgi:hypothetical protein